MEKEERHGLQTLCVDDVDLCDPERVGGLEKETRIVSNGNGVKRGIFGLDRKGLLDLLFKLLRLTRQNIKTLPKFSKKYKIIVFKDFM